MSAGLTTPGFVYFIQQDGDLYAVKIGHASDVYGRLRTLMTASAVHLQLLLAVPGSRSLEAALHRRFKVYHVEREWFKPGPDLLRYIIANSTLPPMDGSGNALPGLEQMRKVVPV